MRTVISTEQSRKGSWSEAANARAEFHLSQILRGQGTNLEEAEQLASHSKSILEKILPLYPLEGVEPGDEIAFFDHLQPVFDGRFVGRTLLKYVCTEPPKRGSTIEP